MKLLISESSLIGGGGFAVSSPYAWEDWKRDWRKAMEAVIYCMKCVYVLRVFKAVNIFSISLEEWLEDFRTCPKCGSHDMMLKVEREEGL